MWRTLKKWLFFTNIDLIFFTTGVPDTNNTSTTRTTRMRHKCDMGDTSETRAIQVRHEWYTKDTSVTRVLHEQHKFDTYFHKHIFTSPPLALYLLYGKWKIIRRGKISFQELFFGNASFPCQNAFEKCTTKTELCKNKSYIKKLYTRL